MQNEQDRHKRLAAERVIDYIEPAMVVGLGTGSTADLVVGLLGDRVASGLQITGVPTSHRTASLARSLGIPLRELQDVDNIDLTVDGADEIESHTLHALKGAGGALLREKLVALDSAKVILVVDDTKIVDSLGSNFAVPVEVVQFGWRVPARRLSELGAEVSIRPDSRSGDPFLTDNDNYVLDARFGPIDDPESLSVRIKEITGVIEHGLFVNVVDEVVVGAFDGAHLLKSRPSPDPTI